MMSDLAANTAPSEPLGVALKEWAVVCHALETGTQVALLRKGGLADPGGAFGVEHPRFWLWPTWLHQSPVGVRPPWTQSVRAMAAEPDSPTLTAIAVVEQTHRVPSWDALQAVGGYTIYSETHLATRWAYKPDKPLWLVIVRVWRVAEPAVINFVSAAMAGCRSWVPLPAPLAIMGASPALDQAAFRDACRGLAQALKGA